MKRKGNIYKEICDFDKIIEATNIVIKNTKNKKTKRDIKKNKMQYVGNIYSMLEKKTFEPSKPTRFTLYEPKKRDIVNLRPIDKIVNYLVARHILEPCLTPCLIDKNVASRKGLGTEAAIKEHLRLRRKYDHKYENYYILKADISKFFPSMDQDIAMEKIKRRIKDKDALNIISKFVYMEEKGLCIGAMTSQIIAIYYLNDLDHYITEDLGLKDYIRYQDDFLIFSDSKEKLKNAKKKIEMKLNEDKLKLNTKTNILNNKSNYIYVGRKLNGKYHKRNESKRKLNQRRRQYMRKEINLTEYISSIRCYENLLEKKKYII